MSEICKIFEYIQKSKIFDTLKITGKIFDFLKFSQVFQQAVRELPKMNPCYCDNI